VTVSIAVALVLAAALESSTVMVNRASSPPHLAQILMFSVGTPVEDTGITVRVADCATAVGCGSTPNAAMSNATAASAPVYFQNLLTVDPLSVPFSL
jgi:hypothetical protein